tara:strand:+ start:10 stop:753 length:744 start_codon:yes stop_codon:yes gene_type:complete
MKLLLENWREYLKEEEYSITPEQNQALKGLYILISRLYEHLNQWIEEKGYDASSGMIKPQIRKEYEPPPHIIKKGQDLYLDISEYKQVFPNLADDFHVKFRPDVDGNAELARLGNEVKYMVVGTKNFSNPMQIKQSIQHELQHIIDKGSEGGNGVEGIINYLSDQGEVRAHAKEAAYRLYKQGAVEVDFEEVKSWGGNYANYYKFAKDPGDIIQRKDIDPSYEQIMKTAGDNFIKYANYFLGLFKGQ